MIVNSVGTYPVSYARKTSQSNHEMKIPVAFAGENSKATPVVVKRKSGLLENIVAGMKAVGRGAAGGLIIGTAVSAPMSCSSPTDYSPPPSPSPTIGPQTPVPTPTATPTEAPDSIQNIVKQWQKAHFNVNDIPNEFSYVDEYVRATYTGVRDQSRNATNSVTYTITAKNNVTDVVSKPYTETYTWDANAKIVLVHRVSSNGVEDYFSWKVGDDGIIRYFNSLGQPAETQEKIAPGKFKFDSGHILSDYEHDGNLVKLQRPRNLELLPNEGKLAKLFPFDVSKTLKNAVSSIQNSISHVA